MQRSDVDTWVELYERAWRSPDTSALADLFTLDARYRPSPWAPPILGLAAIERFWLDERDSPDERFTLSSQVIAVDGDLAVVRVAVNYEATNTAPAQAWRDLWIVEFEPAGKCRSFEEWPFAPTQSDGHDRGPEPDEAEPVDELDRLALQGIAAGEPTQWFERAYAAGRSGAGELPWNRHEPREQLWDWVEAAHLDGTGKTAVVVGCGLGADAEYIASLGFATTAFDIAPSAIAEVRERYPDSLVDYQVADLLNLPPEWHHAFDLVVEVYTLQALPDPPRAQAITAITDLVGPGGTLIAIQFVDTDDPSFDPRFPPYPLSAEHIRMLAQGGLNLTSLDRTADQLPRWIARLDRPGSGSGD